MEIDPNAGLESMKIGRELIQYSAPVFIVSSITASDIVASGTFSFVETPKERVLVTAYHVWRRYKELKAEHSDAVFCVGLLDGIFELANHIYLDGDESTLDLAVFRSPPGAAYFRKRFFKIPQWPIPRVLKGESVDVIGYAGADRETKGSAIDLGYTHFGFGVSSVADRHFVLGPDLGPRMFVLKNPQHGEKFGLGGMSGGPVFCARDGIYHLVGFVRAGDTSDSFIFISHAAFLREDGTLDHLSIPG